MLSPEISQRSQKQTPGQITRTPTDEEHDFPAMSQGYYPGGRDPSSGEGSSRHAGEEERVDSPFFPNPPPAYMTVGNGTTSDSATALMASLNNDSGYGGSIASGEEGTSWHEGLLEDRPTPTHTATQPGEWNPAGSSFVPSCVKQSCKKMY